MQNLDIAAFGAGGKTTINCYLKMGMWSWAKADKSGRGEALGDGRTGQGAGDALFGCTPDTCTVL